MAQENIEVKIEDLVIGNIYKVIHRRKGTFKMMVNSVNAGWVSGILTKGKTFALLPYNEVEEGEELTVGNGLATFYLS